MPQQEPNFAELIERAQQVGSDVAGPFPSGPGRVAFQPGRAPGVPEFDFSAKMAVFNLPSDSAEYEEVLNQLLRGEAVLRYEEKTFDKDGNFLVAICYMTPNARPAQPANGDAGDHEPLDRHERLA